MEISTKIIIKNIYLERFDLGVSPHVDVKDGGSSEALITVRADVGSAARVGPQMLL